MDLIGVREIRVPSTRDDLRFGAGELPLGGGSWLFSEDQPGLTGLVDLTALGWRPLSETDATLDIAATCTLAQLAAVPARADWAAHPLLWQCCTSLLGSFKVWNTATVGGNIALALPAGPMTALATALDATALVWSPDGGERRERVETLVSGVRETTLAHGEVLRAIEIPLASLADRTGFRRISLSPVGRTGTLVIGRLDPAGLVITVTGGTTAPRVLRFAGIPTAGELAAGIDAIDDWYDDAHGSPDWRLALSARFAEELRVELGGAA